MYKEYSPDLLLSPYIDKYWATQGVLIGEQRMKIAGDCCVDIIFAYGESARIRSMEDYCPYIVGTMSSYAEELFFKEINMLGIRFKPGGIKAFVRLQVNELNNIKVDLKSFDSLFDQDFYLSLQGTDNVTKLIEYINSYLLAKLPFLYETEERVVYAVNLIDSYKGVIPVKEVADKACLSSRQFERLFKNAVGISAKTYCRIARFKHTKRYLKENPNNTLFSTAVDCGYYDHAHLIKDFMVLSGESPKLITS